MDIDRIIEQGNEEDIRSALAYFLNQFTTPAFGALPKNEVELIVLNVLEKINAIASEPEVYELVSKLRVNRSKARNLIYNRELRKSSAEELDEKVKSLLKRPLIQKDGEQFILEVENPLVSDHLRSKVQKLGYVSDGSFSPSIIKLGLDAISALTESLLPVDEKENLRLALVRAGAPDVSLRGILKATFKKVAKKLASETGEVLIEKASEYISPILDLGIDLASEKVGILFNNDEPED